MFHKEFMLSECWDFFYNIHSIMGINSISTKYPLSSKPRRGTKYQNSIVCSNYDLQSASPVLGNGAGDHSIAMNKAQCLQPGCAWRSSDFRPWNGSFRCVDGATSHTEVCVEMAGFKF